MSSAACSRSGRIQPPRPSTPGRSWTVNAAPCAGFETPPPFQLPPQFLRDLSYDQYQAIGFRHDHALWAQSQSAFRLEFFHCGRGFKEPVELYEIVLFATFTVPPLQYTPPPNSQLNFSVTGDVGITLGDTQAKGPGTTQFTFQVVDQTGATHAQVPVTAVIHTEGPNGTPANVNVVGAVLREETPREVERCDPAGPLGPRGLRPREGAAPSLRRLHRPGDARPGRARRLPLEGAGLVAGLPRRRARRRDPRD